MNRQSLMRFAHQSWERGGGDCRMKARLMAGHYRSLTKNLTLFPS